MEIISGRRSSLSAPLDMGMKPRYDESDLFSNDWSDQETKWISVSSNFLSGQRESDLVDFFDQG